MAYEPFFRSAEQTATLNRLLSDAQRWGQGHTAVFDLDGCLFDNRFRQIQIFREFAAQHGAYELYRVEAEHFVDWSLKTTMLNAGIDAATAERLHPPVDEHWDRHFFRSEYCLFDHAMPGAPQFVWSIYRAGLNIVYLSGRDESMRPGTEESLKRFGFPIGRPRTQVILKPDFEQDDVSFKDEALREIRLVGEPRLLLDNEPQNVNLFVDHVPGGTVVMVETDHSPRPIVPSTKALRIKGFLP